jgi:asparagine N-glycosylation enzyme membrane subunit Stt3
MSAIWKAAIGLAVLVILARLAATVLEIMVVPGAGLRVVLVGGLLAVVLGALWALARAVPRSRRHP